VGYITSGRLQRQLGEAEQRLSREMEVRSHENARRRALHERRLDVVGEVWSRFLVLEDALRAAFPRGRIIFGSPKDAEAKFQAATEAWAGFVTCFDRVAPLLPELRQNIDVLVSTMNTIVHNKKLANDMFEEAKEYKAGGARDEAVAARTGAMELEDAIKKVVHDEIPDLREHLFRLLVAYTGSDRGRPGPDKADSQAESNGPTDR
jgi:hypothetical protein